MLNDDLAARAKPGLQPVIAEHDEWLRPEPARPATMTSTGMATAAASPTGGVRRRVVTAASLDEAVEALRVDIARLPNACFELIWRVGETEES